MVHAAVFSLSWLLMLQYFFLLVIITNTSAQTSRRRPAPRSFNDQMRENMTVLNTHVDNLNRKVETLIEKLDNRVTKTCDIYAMSDCLPARFVLKSPVDESDVLCDTKTDGGGWVVILRRLKGDVEFNRTWDIYRLSFGSFQGDYWHGLENIYTLVQHGTWELRVDMRYRSKDYYANYGTFLISDAFFYHALHVTNYTGTAGDGLSAHNNARFATRDNYVRNSCRSTFKAGWWFTDNCVSSNPSYLTGKWEMTGSDVGVGIHWESLTGRGSSLEFVEMKIRRRSFKTNSHVFMNDLG